MIKFDKVLGLNLRTKLIKIPKEVEKLIKQREILRKKDKFREADRIRKQIEDLGYKISDKKRSISS
jgi:cysteinyl-tRNA synthetase